VADTGALPSVQEARSTVLASGYLVDQPRPTTVRVQADDDQRDQPGKDHEELQHLVVDRRGEPTSGDVRENEGSSNDDREPDGPPQQCLDDDREGVKVDARDQNSRDGKASCVELVGRRVEALEHVLRDAAHLRAVVERHHHDTEEDHRRHGADPVEVRRRDAVLRAVRGHAKDLESSEVRRDEGEASHPGRQRTPGEEEVQAALDAAPGREPDAEDDHEIDQQDGVVQPVHVQAQAATHDHLAGSPKYDETCSRSRWSKPLPRVTGHGGPVVLTSSRRSSSSSGAARDR
jgi:hypothetical protein